MCLWPHKIICIFLHGKRFWGPSCLAGPSVNPHSPGVAQNVCPRLGMKKLKTERNPRLALPWHMSTLEQWAMCVCLGMLVYLTGPSVHGLKREQMSPACLWGSRESMSGNKVGGILVTSQLWLGPSLRTCSVSLISRALHWLWDQSWGRQIGTTPCKQSRGAPNQSAELPGAGVVAVGV